ncbi:MAG: GNAT family N-acetyltransferase [Cyanobacteria bacterium Co-bin8]|nr:GNAT family N-acetyltransferase [Cyanobacteria bacterium Co-bin8]
MSEANPFPHADRLPPGCCLRKARAEDSWAIRWRVLQARLDPTQLRWQQFWVIECDKEMIACGQLRQFEGGQELGSLVVAPQWRGQGLGILLTTHLIQQASGPLYLECLGERLAHFYYRLSFKPAIWDTMPPALQRKFRLSQRISRWLRLPLHVLCYEIPPLQP